LKSPINTWLLENEKFVVNERNDDQYHESYWVWPKKSSSKRRRLIPVLVGHLKEFQRGQDCVLVGWRWIVDMKQPYVKTVMNNEVMRDTVVQQLKQIINNHFRISFLPDDESFSTIRVFTLLLTSQLTKKKLHDSIRKSWLKYAEVLFQFEGQRRAIH
jgi:hypothetical protein